MTDTYVKGSIAVGDGTGLADPAAIAAEDSLRCSLGNSLFLRSSVMAICQDVVLTPSCAVEEEDTGYLSVADNTDEDGDPILAVNDVCMLAQIGRPFGTSGTAANFGGDATPDVELILITAVGDLETDDNRKLTVTRQYRSTDADTLAIGDMLIKVGVKDSAYSFTWYDSVNRTLKTISTNDSGGWAAPTVKDHGAIAWADVSKISSSLADLATRSAGDLSSGNLAIARMPTGGTWSLSSDLTLSGKDLIINSTEVIYPYKLTYSKTVTQYTASFAAISMLDLCFAPASATSQSFSGMDGQPVIRTTNWADKSTVNGLNFYPYCDDTAGSTYLTCTGISTMGVLAYGAFNAKAVRGLTVRGGQWAYYGSLTVADYAAGIYVSTSKLTSCPNSYGIFISQQTSATRNYQLALEGTGDGSGIWFNAGSIGSSAITNYARIYSSAASTLDFAIDVSGTPSVKMTIDSTGVGFFAVSPVAQQANIADAKVDYTTGDLDSEAEIISAFNTTNTKINSLIAILEAFGLSATS